MPIYQINPVIIKKQKLYKKIVKSFWQLTKKKNLSEDDKDDLLQNKYSVSLRTLQRAYLTDDGIKVYRKKRRKKTIMEKKITKLSEFKKFLKINKKENSIELMKKYANDYNSSFSLFWELKNLLKQEKVIENSLI